MGKRTLVSLLGGLSLALIAGACLTPWASIVTVQNTCVATGAQQNSVKTTYTGVPGTPGSPLSFPGECKGPSVERCRKCINQTRNFIKSEQNYSALNCPDGQELGEPITTQVGFKSSKTEPCT